jgi:hypothetical protein
MVMTKKIRWVGWMGIYADGLLMGNPEESRPLGRQIRRYLHNNEINLGKI